MPVLRNAERMNFADIELGISELGIKVSMAGTQGKIDLQ